MRTLRHLPKAVMPLPVRLLVDHGRPRDVRLPPIVPMKTLSPAEVPTLGQFEPRAAKASSKPRLQWLEAAARNPKSDRIRWGYVIEQFGYRDEVASAPSRPAAMPMRASVRPWRKIKAITALGSAPSAMRTARFVRPLHDQLIKESIDTDCRKEHCGKSEAADRNT